MTGFARRLLAAILALACLVSAAHSQTRPIGVEDIVALEAFGRASISPDGAWAVYEKRGAYETTPRFDYGQRSVWAIMDLWRVDLTRPGAAPEPLLPGEGPGLLRGPWSPSGKRLMVQRFRDARYEVGVVTLADRSVRWTGLTPEIPLTGAWGEWVSDDQVALMVRPDGSLPALLRYYGASQTRATQAWARTSLGREPSRTVIETRGGVATSETPAPDQALVLVDAATGTSRTLARGRVFDLSVSPDARRLAVLLGGAPLPVRPDAAPVAEGPARQRLALFNLEEGSVARPIDGLDVAPHLLRWSAESSRLLLWAREDGEAWTDGELMTVGRDGPVVVDRGGLSPGSAADILRGVRADWLGETPVLYARPSEGGRFDWRVLEPGCPPRPLTGDLSSVPSHLAAVSGETLHLFADGGVWAVDRTGARRLGPPDRPAREAVISDPELTLRLKLNTAPRRDWLPALGPDGESLVVAADGTVRRLGPGEGAQTRVLAASRDAALVLDRAGLVETLRLRTPDGDRALDRVNADRAEVALTAPTPVDHRDALGRDTRSWLFLPPGRGPGAVKGLVVQVYPGSVDAGAWSGPMTLTYGVRPVVLAGAGYAVLTPSIPIDAPETASAEFWVQSVDLAVDAALAAHPELPRDRIAIMGHSFGGHAALAIATRSTRYRSYIASSAMSDLFGEWGEFIPATRHLPEDGFMMINQQAWVESGQGGLSKPPWADPAAYVERSPWLAADRITAPVLLITADKDFVPMSQSERLFSALYRQGGTARLVTYWGEHHHLWSPANIRDLYSQVLGWLEQTLAASPPVGGAPAPR